jgi:hypothetical protein
MPVELHLVSSITFIPNISLLLIPFCDTAAPQVAGLAAYLRSYPGYPGGKSPGDIKNVIVALQRRLSYSPEGENSARPVNMVWNGRSRPDAACNPTRRDLFGRQSCPQPDGPDGSGNGPSPLGPPVGYRPGPAGPICTANCGKLCDGYYCSPSPTGTPPDFSEPDSSTTAPSGGTTTDCHLTTAIGCLGQPNGPSICETEVACAPTPAPCVTQVECVGQPNWPTTCVTDVSCPPVCLHSTTDIGCVGQPNGPTICWTDVGCPDIGLKRRLLPAAATAMPTSPGFFKHAVPTSFSSMSLPVVDKRDGSKSRDRRDTGSENKYVEKAPTKTAAAPNYLPRKHLYSV